eukprot:CAMPEP_0198284898 /NCGR_PEP_ID=MMETSP1449-20131203/4274_1 /TAXON_ID=420275 /ORGANISM="Attheya septentrionalis, Strain CCMP2084" /LENGTH=594 /DNA_ID=CAMNT_0043982119 /DNA_START=42 /DNA_END=1826 /DNA_ORIENTATION=-
MMKLLRVVILVLASYRYESHASTSNLPADELEDEVHECEALSNCDNIALEEASVPESESTHNVNHDKESEEPPHRKKDNDSKTSDKCPVMDKDNFNSMTLKEKNTYLKEKGDCTGKAFIFFVLTEEEYKQLPNAEEKRDHLELLENLASCKGCEIVLSKNEIGKVSFEQANTYLKHVKDLLIDEDEEDDEERDNLMAFCADQGWEDKDIKSFLKKVWELRCYQSSGKEEMIPNGTLWSNLRELLHYDDVGTSSTKSRESGMQIPFQVQHVSGKEFGVFTTEPVQKGTLLWKDQNFAVFHDCDEFSKFLFSNHSDIVACEIMQMVTKLEDADDGSYIAIDLDEGSLIKMKEGANSICSVEANDVIHAARDIDVGEEVICDRKPDYIELDDCSKFGWNNNNTDNLNDIMGCNDILDNTRPSPNETTWLYLLDLYIEIVGPKGSHYNKSNKSGMQVPYKVVHIPGKGRGLVATAPVERGTLIWDDTRRAHFDDCDAFKRFLFLIPSVALACDMIVWTYAGGSDGKIESISIALDDGSLVNHDDDNNASCHPDEEPEDDEGCPILYAVRDIKAGEEFTCMYDDELQGGDEFINSSSSK